MRAPKFHAFLILAFSLTAFGQDPPSSSIPEASQPLTASEKKREALNRVVVRKEAIEAEIAEARDATSDQTLTEFERSEAAKKIARLQLEIASLDQEFSRVASGISLKELETTSGASININEEIKEIFRPVIHEFREITKAPRNAEDLRNQIEELERKLGLIVEAQSVLADSSNLGNPKSLQEALGAEQTRLSEARQTLETELSIARAKLGDLGQDSPTFVKSLSEMIQEFFRTRGLHLLLAIFSAGFTIFFARTIYRMVLKLSPAKVSQAENLTGRMIHLCYIALSALGAILAFVLALYLANDWLLLAITLLFLFGVAWTGKQALPRFFEQSKLILNLGSVRYGERLIYQGIPWQVQKINFYTTLENPSLEGGHIRLPMRDLMPLHSRPNGPRELWFPCKEDDWVILSDGTMGKIIQQTPDYVHLVKLGGSRKVIPTADFLSLHPENISKNFRITITFGIDYQHQEIAIDQVPQILENQLKDSLLGTIEEEQLHHLEVLFTSASASSLDYRIVADFDGDLASRFDILHDALQATCVDCCNEQNWVIPFTQITVHQAS